MDRVLVGIGTTSPTYQLELSLDSAAKPTSSTWTVPSDERIKEDISIANYSQCEEIMKNLELRYYKYKDTIPSYDSTIIPDRRRLGWIAQEVEEVLPKSVRTIPERHGFNNFKQLDSDQIYAVMYGTIKKLMEDKEDLYNRVNSLSEQIERMKQV